MPRMEGRLRLYLVLPESAVIECETKFRLSEHILDRKTISFQHPVILDQDVHSKLDSVHSVPLPLNKCDFCSPG